MTANAVSYDSGITSSSGLRAYALRLHLIGPMRAFAGDDTDILPLGRKTRALLAILALSAPRSVARSRLASLLWSRRLEEQARASLRQEIHRLAEALGPAGVEVVRVTRDQMALRSEVVWTDVQEVLRATAVDPSPLALLEGTLLEEFTGVDPALNGWLAAERDRLRDRVRALSEELLREPVAPDAAILIAQRLLSLERGHEGAWRAMIQAYATQGDRGLAIQTFERCRIALAEVLGAAPSADTQRLVADIRAGRPANVVPPRPGNDHQPMPRSAATIGVMPLHLLSNGEEEKDLVAGLAEELTSALARFRWMAVVAASSLSQFGSRDEAALQRHFGLDFLLDGSVHRVGRRLRITMQLIDLRNRDQIVWARRFDRQMNDMLSLLDEIAAEIVAQIDPEVMRVEGRRATHNPAAEPSAYDLVLRALPLIHRLQRDEFDQAGALLSRALVQEPDYAAAHAWRAYWSIFYVGQGWADNPAEARREAARLAERAIVLDPQDARGLTIAGHVRAFLQRRPHQALELYGRALSLNPNLPMAWGYSAITHVYLGDFAEAGRRFARYKRLAAQDPIAFYFDAAMTLMEIQNRDYAAAVLLGRRGSELNPNFLSGLKHLLSALGHAGELAEATRVRGRLLSIQPSFTVQAFLDHSAYDRAEHTEHYANGLRLAGLPEGAVAAT